jgi:receptor protein-tyrosine kinase
VNFRAFVRALRLRGWSIALITLAVLAVSLAVTLMQVPLYASTAHLFVAAGEPGAGAKQGQFAEQRMQSYVEVFDGDTIARRVIKRLDLDETPAELSEQIDASVDAKSVVLAVRVKDPSADRAQLLAAAVAKEFIAFLDELETSASSESAAPIKATLVDAPDKPAKPATPNVPLNLGIGLALGLLLGLLWAWVRERSDTTVRTASVLEDATDAPMLGAILFDEHAFDQPTIRDLDHYDPRVEGYRILRTSLQFLDSDPSAAESGAPAVLKATTPKVYVVTSAVPGEGKTTTAINLALILAEGGERVLLVEADLRRPTISEYLHLNPAIGLTTTLIGRTTLAEAVQQVGALDVLTSGRRPPNPAELVKSRPMGALIAKLREAYTYVLIDAPPLLPVTDASLLAAASDGVILVTRYGDTKEVELGSAITRLTSVGSKVVGCILNMTPASDADGYGYGYGYAPNKRGQDAPPEKPRPPKVAKAPKVPKEPREPREPKTPKPPREPKVQRPPRPPRKVKSPKKPAVMVEEVPYASLLARIDPTLVDPAAPEVEAEPRVDQPAPAVVEPEGETFPSGQSLLDQINSAMALAESQKPAPEPETRAHEPEPEPEPQPAEPEPTDRVASSRAATPWWGYAAEAFTSDAARADQPEPESDTTGPDPAGPDVREPEVAEPDPPVAEDKPEPEPAPETEPEPERAVRSEPESEPNRPMVWPASWAVQTAASFVESEESDETTHRFPGSRNVATDPDEEDLVGEAEPMIEPTETTD